jgi:putative endonuclease
MSPWKVIAGWWGRLRPGDSLGRRGERFAARWLRQRGCRVLHRNYRIGRDEADLVVLDPEGPTVVIVEVKTRAAVHPDPAEGIGLEKRRAMARLAARLQSDGAYAGCATRLDAIVIVWPPQGPPQLRHYPAVEE